MARKGPPDGSWSGRNNVERRQDQAKAAAEQRLEAYRQTVEARAAQRIAEAIAIPPPRNLDALMAALNELPLRRLGDANNLRLGGGYAKLVDTTIRCINERAKHTVLCWPNADPAPAAIVSLLSLGECAASESTTRNGFPAFASPRKVRGLVYPFARTERNALKKLYADQAYIAKIQLKHQNRYAGPSSDPGLEDYHKTAARVSSLNGRALDGKEYDQFRHPCLDELLPSGPCEGTGDRTELLWRVRPKTDLRNFTRTRAADDPSTAPFYLLWLHADNEKSLAKAPPPIDVCILDLTITGRQRLGREWVARAQDFVAQLEKHFGDVPIVALTDDPWSFDSSRFEIFGEARKSKRRKTPGASSVIFSDRLELAVTANATPRPFEGGDTFEVRSFGGALEILLTEARRLRRRAFEFGDNAAVRCLNDIAGAVRRCTSLPAPLPKFEEYVASEDGEQGAQLRLAKYRITTTLAELEKSLGPLAQAERKALNEFVTGARSVWNNAQLLTPMAPLFENTLRPFLGASSRTIALFENEMVADFAADALSKTDNFAGRVVLKLQKKVLYFLDRAGLDDLDEEPDAYRNQIKTLIVVGPSRSSLLTALARPWLPERTIVLADIDTLHSTARDAVRLATYPELVAIKGRLERFARRASQTLAQVTNAAVDLNAEVVVSEDDDLSSDQILDLSTGSRGSGLEYTIQLENGDTIVARPGSRLVVQDNSGVVPIFKEEEAQHVEKGDRVCFMGEEFLQSVRPLLNMTVRAAEEIRDYHQLVIERFAQVPGASETERLGHVLQKMGYVDLPIATARYWVRLAGQLDVPLPDVVPHAPREKETFLAFMKALDVSERLAQKYWIWAVVAQRSIRVKASVRFHEAYRNILVNPYAAQSDNPGRARDIQLVVAEAENYVFSVRSKKKIGASDARS